MMTTGVRQLPGLAASTGALALRDWTVMTAPATLFATSRTIRCHHRPPKQNFVKEAARIAAPRRRRGDYSRAVNMLQPASGANGVTAACGTFVAASGRSAGASALLASGVAPQAGASEPSPQARGR